MHTPKSNTPHIHPKTFNSKTCVWKWNQWSERTIVCQKCSVRPAEMKIFPKPLGWIEMDDNLEKKLNYHPSSIIPRKELLTGRPKDIMASKFYSNSWLCIIPRVVRRPCRCWSLMTSDCICQVFNAPFFYSWNQFLHFVKNMKTTFFRHLIYHSTSSSCWVFLLFLHIILTEEQALSQQM